MNDFQVVHFSAGRLRVRLAQILNNPEFGSQVETMLSTIEGIHKVSTSVVTGSVLVEFDPSGIDLESLLALGKLMNLAPADLEIPALGPPDTLAAGMALIGETLGAALEGGGRVVGKALNPRVALPAATINAVAQRAGMGISPVAATIWVVASMLLNPKRTRPTTANREQERSRNVFDREYETTNEAGRSDVAAARSGG